MSIERVPKRNPGTRGQLSFLTEATPRKFKGPLAEWLGSGLQNRVHQFKSGTDLKLFFDKVHGILKKLSV